VETRVDHDETALGTWTRASRAADPRLADLLARGHVGFVESASGFDSWLIPPDGRATIIVNLGDAFGGLPPAFVAGLSDRADAVGRGEKTACVDIKLTPLGAYRIFGVPMHELAGRAVDAADVLGADAAPLVEALRAAPGWDERFCIACPCRRATLVPRQGDELRSRVRSLVLSP
jgi:hypothetical protein